MVVFGFIGTFGPWHGAEVLARAFVQLLSDAPALKDRVRLLMIGDGPRRAATEAIIREARLSTAVHFTGRTRQEDGPAHLAACDVLLSPHVPNHDGTPFFGSPTKLFEYMAMGKPIIASRLDQIGEVLTDNVTALLVSPGDTDELAAAMRALLDDPQRRARLGAAARREAVANHTWLEHTRRILDRLRSTYA
jgi:glycosyltransferase involved in cell wall biosynthesis